MNRSPDVELVLRDLLAEDNVPAPDRILSDVADRISAVPRRRAWRLPWRLPVMNSNLKLAAGLATVAVIAVIGWRLLPGSGEPGGPSPSPSPTLIASPSAAASASAVFPQWFTPTRGDGGAGILAAGSHASKAFTPPFTYTVPDGWVNAGDAPGFLRFFKDTQANQTEFARSGVLAQQVFGGPHPSPWFVCEPMEHNSGATAAEMVDALMASEAVSTSGVIDVTIGGLSGKRFDTRLNPGWTGTCPPTPEDPPDLADGRSRNFLLDNPGHGVIVIFASSITSADFEAFAAEAIPIVESFQFDFGIGPSPRP